MNTPALKLLIVDDDDIDLETTERAFDRQQWSISVTTAHDGQEALELLRQMDQASPVVILLDLNMPKMNGIEFLHELRNDPDLKHHVVFVLTTSRAPEDKCAAYQHHVAGYIVKSDMDESYTQLTTFLKAYEKTTSFPQQECANNRE